MDRYNRQVILPEIGEAGQDKLRNASVLVIGAGGLGCPCMQYLAGAGIGQIGIVDHDVVDESNLHRQILYSMDQIGQNKAQVAKENLLSLNPNINITALPDKLRSRNAAELFQDYDLIIDGSDNFKTKYLINDAALIAGKPFVYGSVLGFQGQVAVFNDSPQAPCYRCLFSHAPRENMPNCAEAGVLGAVAGIIGTMQALEAIKIIVDTPDLRPLSGQILIYDAKKMVQRTMTLLKDVCCPVCSKPKEDIILERDIQIVSVDEAKNRDNVKFLDVREPDEYAAGHIKGAVNLPLSAIMAGKRPDFATDENVVVNCKSGVRCKQAIEILKAEGYENLASLDGGYLAWISNNLI